MSPDYDTTYSDAQIDRWHREAEEKATQAKHAERAGNDRRARQLRKEAKQLVFKAARLRGNRG
jgi:hypothetical protein